MNFVLGKAQNYLRLVGLSRLALSSQVCLRRFLKQLTRVSLKLLASLVSIVKVGSSEEQEKNGGMWTKAGCTECDIRKIKQRTSCVLLVLPLVTSLMVASVI